MADYLNLRSSLASDPLRNFRFIARFTALSKNMGVNFDTKVGFTSIQGLNVQTEAIPYREGGYNTTVHYLPGQQTFSPVTFQRGVVVGTRQNWDWFLRLFDPGTNGSTAAFTEDNKGLTSDFRCAVTIDVLGHPRPKTQDFTMATDNEVNLRSTPAAYMRFVLLNAWPTNIAYSDLNATDNAVLVEQMTVVHEGLTLRWEGGEGNRSSWNPGFNMYSGYNAGV